MEFPMQRFLAVVAATLLMPMAAIAQCAGTNMMATMMPEARAAVQTATDAAPFSRGNLWRATKDGVEATIVGTYHLADPRHAPTMERIRPLVAAANRVLVEAGPDEESALLAAITRDPGLMLITEGPSLLEQLEPDEWDQLATAMRARSIPPFMAAKFRPWYVSMMLALPPCMMDAATLNDGLDQQVINLAAERSIPVQALEPFDTLFKIFAQMSTEDQLNMIRSTLLLEEQSADVSFTLAEAYFSEDSRAMWEFMRILSREMPGYTPEQADAEFARLEEVLMASRNRAWIPVIENAAVDGRIFIAFGVLHLSGDEGVLNLLAKAGWTVERLPL
jgi:hypothetical protein